MKTSREILTKAGLLPKLQLGIKSGRGVTSTGKHTVKMVEDKVIKKPAMEEGDDVHWVRYIVEEDGVQKQYDTRMKQKGGVDPSYFVQAMASVEPGEIITLEMRKSGIKNYIEIVRTSVGEMEMVEDDEESEPRVRGDGRDEDNIQIG